MSVLLTAVKVKSKKLSQPQHKHQSSSSLSSSGSAGKLWDNSSPSDGGGAPLPPLSNDNTAVWTWEEDGVTTTIMLSRDSMQLWCNGVVIEADELITDGDLEFEIYHKHTNKSNNARIMAAPDERGVMTYNLYLDGNFIAEHTAGTHFY